MSRKGAIPTRTWRQKLAEEKKGCIVGSPGAWCPLLSSWTDRLLTFPLLWKAPEQPREFVPLIGKGNLDCILAGDAASFTVSSFVVFRACSPLGRFQRNTDIRSSVEEWQNTKESQGSQKELSTISYIWKLVILCDFSQESTQ